MMWIATPSGVEVKPGSELLIASVMQLATMIKSTKLVKKRFLIR